MGKNRKPLNVCFVHIIIYPSCFRGNRVHHLRWPRDQSNGIYKEYGVVPPLEVKLSPTTITAMRPALSKAIFYGFASSSLKQTNFNSWISLSLTHCPLTMPGDEDECLWLGCPGSGRLTVTENRPQRTVTVSRRSQWPGSSWPATAIHRHGGTDVTPASSQCHLRWHAAAILLWLASWTAGQRRGFAEASIATTVREPHPRSHHDGRHQHATWNAYDGKVGFELWRGMFGTAVMPGRLDSSFDSLIVMGLPAQAGRDSERRVQPGQTDAISSSHEKQTAIKPRASESRDREFSSLHQWIAMRNRFSPTSPRYRTSLVMTRDV